MHNDSDSYKHKVAPFNLRDKKTNRTKPIKKKRGKSCTVRHNDQIYYNTHCPMNVVTSVFYRFPE